MISLPQINKKEESIKKEAGLEKEDLLKIINDLRENQIDSENQRKAVFNILEDVDESQEELKKRYSELNVIKRLVQNLGDSLQTKTIMETLVLALKEAFSEEVNFAFVIPSFNSTNFSNSIYIYASSPLNNKYLKTIKKSIEGSINSTSDELKIKKKLVKWINSRFLYEFTEGRKNDNDTKQPLSIFNVSLVVRDELLGIINISSFKSASFTKKDIDFANTTINITASTISRLRQLLDSEQSRTQSLVKSLSNGVIMFGLDKKVTMSNQAAQKMTGFPERGFYLSEFAKLLDNQDEKEVVQKISETLKTGESHSFEEIKICT